MHQRRLAFILVLTVVAVALLVPAAFAAAPAHAAGMLTYDQAVDQLYAKGYPQNVETYLDSLGTSPLGFRLGGTNADDAAAKYICNASSSPLWANEREARGRAGRRVGRARRQRHRRLEHVFTCSQFAGVPGTGGDGVTAEVVYVGNGLAADYEGVDVNGKIVVVDSSMDNFWFNFQGAEATKHGASRRHPHEQHSDGRGPWTTRPPRGTSSPIPTRSAPMTASTT